MKKISKLFKSNFDSLIAVVPSSSKMAIFLQFMDVWKKCIAESNKSSISLLKLTFQWLQSIISSFQSISEFEYVPLIDFTVKALEVKYFNRYAFSPIISLFNMKSSFSRFL